jgi:hypothetical protein
MPPRRTRKVTAQQADGLLKIPAPVVARFDAMLAALAMRHDLWDRLHAPQRDAVMLAALTDGLRRLEFLVFDEDPRPSTKAKKKGHA